jgi:hypothetical protein
VRAALLRLVLVAASAVLASCRRPAGERAVPSGTAPVQPTAGAEAARDAGAQPSAIDHDAGPVTNRGPPGQRRCAANVDTRRKPLEHRATWNAAWAPRPPSCKDACVVGEEQSPDGGSAVVRYHLVLPVRQGGFDVLEDVAIGKQPERCGQGVASETLVEGDPLHVHVMYLITAGREAVREIDDAGEPEIIGWQCGLEGSETVDTDLFIDRARHEIVLVVTQHMEGAMAAEVTASAGVVRIRGAGCDEQLPLRAQP